MNIGPLLRAMKHNRTRVTLIVLEIAMTLAIVTNCVNVILVERARMQQPSGFDDANILWMRMRPFSPEWRQPGFVDPMIDSDVRTIAAIPGVRAVANTNFQMWEGGGSSTGINVAGSGRRPIASQIYYGTRDLIQALGANLVAGRPFRDGEIGVGTQDDPTNVVIISKAVADDLFPDGQAVGKAIQEAGDVGQPQNGSHPMTVVGVVGEFYNPFGLGGGDRETLGHRGIFIPGRVGGWRRGISYQIRTEPGAMRSVMPQIEKRLLATNNGRVFDFLSTPEKKGRWFASGKIIVTALSCIIFALVAVTALGLLGLTSLSVTERTRQIGTRRALGATRRDILMQFITENWLVTTAGLALGIFGAYALNFALVSKMSDAKLDWRLVAIGILLLWVNGLLATIPPAMRAMRIAPAIATRSI